MAMTLSEELEKRGFINQSTLKDNKWLDKPKTVYFGVDPSADSLHVGNLASFMPLRHMLDKGWKVILLVGGATGMIGDPGGKSEERNLLTPKQLEANKKAVRAQVQKLFAGQEFELVDNHDWLSKVDLIEFLRDTGKHFSMTPLVQRDYIAKRIGEGGAGISYTEFSYTLLQGYDYWHLYKKYGCVLQFGGSDQWGNMLSGVELIRKKEGAEAHVLSGPLIVDKSTGNKFGKTEGGAIWLDGEKTSPFQFYQFWLNVDDEAVKDYLKYFTLLSISQIGEIILKFDADKAGRLAQKTLAYEVTKLVHGEEKAKSIAKVSEVLFGQGNFLDLNEKERAVLAEGLPNIAPANDPYDTVVLAGLAKSKTEARNFHAAGAIYINGSKISADQPIIFKKGTNLIKRGKNSFALVVKH